MRRYVGLLIVLVLQSSALAQADRYELGLRLRSFEKTWDLMEDGSARQRSVAPLNQAVRSFFSFNFPAAAEHLDNARHALVSPEPASVSIRWGCSLTFLPQRRFIDTSSRQVEILIKPFYKVTDELPKDANARISLCHPMATEVSITQVPHTVQLPVESLEPGDHLLTIQVQVAGERVATRQIMISCAHDLAGRLARLNQIADELQGSATIEQATLRHLLSIVTNLSSGTVMETDIPAARLLHEAEQLAHALLEGKQFYVPERSGQFWLRIPTDRALQTVRIFIPEGLVQGELVPTVVALHGAGGSENLFFDGYGDGITQRLCQERGWIMVAPRSGALPAFGVAPDVLGILDQLVKRFPIDSRKVYLIGHSMGAGHAVALAQQSPERFAGVALLGGGRALRNMDSLKSVPIFMGVGNKDFALGPARNLANALKNANVDRLEFKEYQNIEHLMIVREAAADVFRFWAGK